MIYNKIIIKTAMIISGLISCPLIAFCQIQSTSISVDETPFISHISVECLETEVKLTVIPDNSSLPINFHLTDATPVIPGLPLTNTTGVFYVPNYNTNQTLTFETEHLNCFDINTISFICAVILPVEFLDFTAKPRDEISVELNWEIMQELNVAKYKVEKSTDGIDFVEIGEVSAKMNKNGPGNYNYIDMDPFWGTNYYRLKVMDKDGTFYYSKIATVVFKAKRYAAKIYPNPAKNIIFVDHSFPDSGPLIVSIFSNLNILVEQIRFERNQIKPTLSFSLENYIAGMYIIKIEDESGQEINEKFFKIE